MECLVLSSVQFSRSKSYKVINISFGNPQQKKQTKFLPGKQKRISIIHRKIPRKGANRKGLSK